MQYISNMMWIYTKYTHIDQRWVENAHIENAEMTFDQKNVFFRFSGQKFVLSAFQTILVSPWEISGHNSNTPYFV